MSALASKRLLIRVDGGFRRGLGHIYRMMALARGLARAGAEVVFCSRQDTAGLALLDQSHAQTHALAADQPLVPPALLAAVAPDAIIVDMLATGEELDVLRAGFAGSLLCVDDVGRGLQVADVVVNPIVFHWGKYDSNDVVAALYEGPEYMVLGEQIRQRIAASRPLRQPAERLLLAFGGSDDHGLSPRVLEALRGLAGALQIRVHQGPASRPSPALAAAMRDHPHTIEMTESGDGFADELCWADLVICAGGVMLYELAALGIPCAAIAAEPHEHDNIRYFSQLGCAADLAGQEAFDPVALREQVARLLLDPSARATMRAAGQKVVDGRGLLRFVEVLEGLLAAPSSRKTSPS